MADHNISIDVKLMSEKVLSELKSIREDLNDIKSNNNLTINVKAPNISSVTRSVNELRKELSQIAQMGMSGGRSNADAIIEALGSGFDGLMQKMDEINNKTVDLHVESDELEVAASRAERLAERLEVAASIASSASSVFSGLGDFGGMFADSFGAMSDMFSFDTLGTAKRYLTAMATKAITGQIGGILQRYDIMNTFVPYMDLAGVDEKTAQASLNAVDQSIRGIPIGLDEAAFRLRKYQMYLGDIDLATAFTIGIQKAITAGGASDQMKTTAYTQIDRLLATGKLGQSRQWLSLFNGLGVSLKFLKQELGLDPNADLKEVASQLANGSIPVNDFINAIARLSENEGLDRAIEIYKGTIEAWRSNINNAVKRAGQNILENVNSVMEDTLGFGITGAMRQIRDGIDTVSKEAGWYIQNNPQHVKTIGDAIGGLIDRVMTLDGGRFVDNLVENIGGLADGIGRIFDSMPPGFLEDFTSFATTWAGPMAAVMKAAQGGLGVVLGVFDRMDDMDMADLMEKITDQIWAMSDAVSFILGLIPDGLLGDLMAFGLVWGRPLASVLSAISGALKDLAGGLTAESFSGANGLMGQLGWLVANHPVLMGVAAAIGAIAFGIGQMLKKEKEYVDSARDQLGLDEIDQKLERYSQLGEELGQAYESFDQNLGLIRTSKEEASTLIEQIFDLYDKLQNTEDKHERHTILEDLANDIAQLQALEPGIDLSQLLHGELDTGAAAELRDLAQAYVDFVSAQAEADAVQSMLTEAYTTKHEAQLAKDDLSKERRNLMQERSEAQREFERLHRYANEHGNPTLVQDQGEEYLIYDKDVTEQLHFAETRANAAADAIKEVDAGIEGLNETTEESDKRIKSLTPDLAELNQEVEKGKNTDYTPLSGESGRVLTEYEQHLEDILGVYSQLRQEQTEALASAVEGFEEIEKLDAKPLSEVTGILQGNNSIEQAYIDDLNAASEWLSGLIDTPEGQAWLEANGAALEKIFSQGFAGRDLIAGLVQSLGDPETLQQYVNEAMTQLGLNEQGGGLMADIMGKILYGEDYENAKAGALDTEEFAWVQGMKEQVVTGIQELAASLAPEGEVGSALTEGVSQTVDSVVEAMVPATDAMGEVKQAASDAEGAISNLATTASGKVGEVDSLSGSLRGVHSAATTAAFAVAALAAAINSLHDKTVTIAVNMASGGAIRAGASAIWHGVFGAYGGPAEYLANGGHPGMAKGIDTIPAWLAPGEFVVKRSAVGLFGSNFMKRVNAMDIGGAFDALMQRVSNPMRLGYGNTYNRDNHATVNNYFYGDNGQNYSQRKAYRFAGSL